MYNYSILYTSFLGNAGGYVGLFLGYALLNVPELFQGFCNWLNTNWNKMKSNEKTSPGSAIESTV